MVRPALASIVWLLSISGAALADEDPAEVAIGERLFLETRFAQLFWARARGDVNARLPAGDPALASMATAAGRTLPGPFAGQTMSCRACHLVDEHRGTAGAGSRAYNDFAPRSPLPAREDGRTSTARNTPALVNAALARQPFLLHADGELTSLEGLVRETLLGRDYGWLPGERALALAHVARVIRDDDGRGELGERFGGAYPSVLAGEGPAPGLRLPPRFRLDVARASDEAVVQAVARLIAAYLDSLVLERDEQGRFSGSAYDHFLARNGLPRAPDPGESERSYARRLAGAVQALERPRWVGAGERRLALHHHPFRFGPLELRGLRLFLREAEGPAPAGPADHGPPVGIGNGVGNCVRCHLPPAFTDFAFHNTGVAQREYDGLHGPGAFARLAVPDLAERNRQPERWLPAALPWPRAGGPFLDQPARDRPGRTDLGLWNVVGNPALPAPQPALRALLCSAGATCRPHELLEQALARFKTPGLRDLGHSEPYLHNGAAADLETVLRHYAEAAELARAGRLRNGAPELAGIVIGPADQRALVAFLRALDEDYE